MEVEELYKALQLVTDTVNQDEIILDVDDFDERTICRGLVERREVKILQYIKLWIR
ncbi:MAG: hypothetical protein HFI40_04545 [Lachnospiraceae bacterium]|nr:hypothetical protein [Lachnospiraceae bacterium]